MYVSKPGDERTQNKWTYEQTDGLCDIVKTKKIKNTRLFK